MKPSAHILEWANVHARGGIVNGGDVTRAILMYLDELHEQRESGKSTLGEWLDEFERSGGPLSPPDDIAVRVDPNDPKRIEVRCPEPPPAVTEQRESGPELWAVVEVSKDGTSDYVFLHHTRKAAEGELQKQIGQREWLRQHAEAATAAKSPSAESLRLGVPDTVLRLARFRGEFVE